MGFGKREHNSKTKENLEYLNIESEEPDDKKQLKIWSKFLKKVRESCIQGIKSKNNRACLGEGGFFCFKKRDRERNEYKCKKFGWFKKLMWFGFVVSIVSVINEAEVRAWSVRGCKLWDIVKKVWNSHFRKWLLNWIKRYLIPGWALRTVGPSD